MALRHLRIFAFALTLAFTAAIAQEPGATLPEANASPHRTSILTAAEATKLLPATVFFNGQSAPVQSRNSAGVRLSDHSLMLVALIDTSGYSSQVQQKYQAYLITEAPLEIDGHHLPAGAYGCGFIVNDSFIVMDIGGHDLFTAHSTSDADLRRPRPLAVIPAPDHQGYRLYAGRSYVTFQADFVS